MTDPIDVVCDHWAASVFDRSLNSSWAWVAPPAPMEIIAVTDQKHQRQPDEADESPARQRVRRC
ncbi:MAG: hypothetical protein WC732_09085 [Candidatus Omnitrophota bacterium]